jgi:O-antigen ligase
MDTSSLYARKIRSEIMNIFMSRKLLNILSYIFLIILVSLATGSFIPDFFVVILFFYFLYLLISKKEIIFYFKNKLIIFLLLFYLYINLRSLITENVLFSLKHSFLFIRFIVLGLVSYLIFYQKKNINNMFFYSTAATLILVLLDSYFQFFVGHNLLGLKSLNPSRITGIFNDKYILGSFLSKFYLFFLIFLFLSKETKHRDLFFFIGNILLIITIFLTGERASFFFSVVSILSLLFLLDIKKRKTILIGSFLMLILLLALIDLKELYQRMFLNPFQAIYSGSLFSEQHTYHYQTAFNMFKENIFFGQGTRMFRFLCDKSIFKVHDLGCATHPHNYYAQFMAELGIVGLLFLMSFYALIISKLFKHLYDRLFYKKYYFKNYEVVVLVYYFCLFFPFTPNADFFNNWILIFIFIPFGLLVKILNKSRA